MIKGLSSIKDLRRIYGEKAICQIPRLLGNQDRFIFSSTYGCFHRDYWLDKTSDFPDAVRQFAVLALALVYKHPFPGNIYQGEAKIRDWAVAGMNFWAQIQHREGSFDEFYPYERGWVGPTAFTTYNVTETLNLLQNEIPDEVKDRVLHTIRRAAYFIVRGESEEDHLANHHAMACLAVWKAYELLGDKELYEGYHRLWWRFLAYNSNEGWSLEYDGVDPGYLSATVSFLGKIYATNPDPDILKIAKQSIEFCSYFVYPNGFYAGSMGSRNTLHFYPHGFEIFGREIPLANAIAEKMLIALEEGKLVPPEIISDRYVVYRVSEYLQAYLDYTPRQDQMPLLPYEGQPFGKFFPESKIWVRKIDHIYSIANLAKGGVIKIFDCLTGDLILNDCGIIGKLANKMVVTSQWIDSEYNLRITENGWEVSGRFNIVPINRRFTPLKHIIFRVILLLVGWQPVLAHALKGKIRKKLMLGNHRVPIIFKRILALSTEHAVVVNEVKIEGKARFEELSFGDEFFVRYVPQSRYFQTQELDVHGDKLEYSELAKLNNSLQIKKEIVIRL